MTKVPQRNDQVGGRYVIERELGRGGMATVFLARDLRHETEVALKVLHPELAPTLTGERFSREIRITAGLQHPNVVPVLDSGTIDGLPFYTMPFIEGETLATRLGRESQLPLDEALRIATDVADALAYAHERGVIHRDIKPQNILLSSGHAVVADFGIAKAMTPDTSDRLTATGIAIGTVTYMSPEQAAGGAVDGRSDIYALGCVLYEMLTGGPAFTGSTPQAVLARHAIDPPPPVRTVRPTVGPLLETVLSRALAKIPADRYATARDLKAALVEATAEQAANSRSGELSPRSHRATRRTVLRAGSVVALVTIAAVAAWVMMRPEAPALDRDRVAVFPLTMRAGVGGPASLGEDLATTIGYALEATGGLQRVDGWRLSRNGGEAKEASRSAQDGRRAIARAQRCGYYLVGDLLPHGDDSVEVMVRLLDTATDSLVVSMREMGRRGDESRLGIRAVNRILPSLIVGAFDRQMVADLVERRPEVVAAFLRGEAALRRGRVSEARQQFRDAVAGDSTFAFAAIRAAQAVAWHSSTMEAAPLVDLAMKQPLPSHYAHLMRALRAYIEGRADSAIRESRRAITVAPDMMWAWLLIGESYRHLLPLQGDPRWFADSAFSQADRLEPSMVLALGHLIESHLMGGRERQVAPLIRRLEATDPDSSTLARLRMLGDCVSKGPSAVDWGTVIEAAPLRVLSAAKLFAAAGAQLPCGEAAYRAMRTFETAEMAAKDVNVDSRRWTALVGLQGVLVAQGRMQEAMALIDTAIARGEGGQSLMLSNAAVVPAFVARAPGARQSYEEKFGRLCAHCASDNHFFWSMAAFASGAADTGTLDALSTALTHRARETPTPRAVQLSRSAAALARAARQDTGAVTALAEALTTTPEAGWGAMEWWVEGGRAQERLELARSLMRGREFERAIEVANVFDSQVSVSFPTYLRASLILRATASESLSNAQGRLAYRARLAALARDSAKAHLAARR